MAFPYTWIVIESEKSLAAVVGRRSCGRRRIHGVLAGKLHSTVRLAPSGYSWENPRNGTSND